jgi:hypothetical protein
MTIFSSHIIRVTGDATWVSPVTVETKEQPQHWMHTHSQNKRKNFEQTLPACQKADGNCFLGQERRANGGVHITRDHNNVRSALRKTKNYAGPFRTKRRGMLTSSVVLLHDNGRPYTASSTPALVERFNWELFDHHPYIPNLDPSDYHLRIYLENCCVYSASTVLSSWKVRSQAAAFFDTGIQKLIPPTR